MSQFNAYFSTLIITYLLEAYALRKISVVSEDELILNITSMVSIMGTKDNIAIPAQNKQLYAEMLNKNSGTMMIVLDELVNATYIIRNKNANYMVNFEHDYIKKFIASHGTALKYVSHPSYSLKQKFESNDEKSLCEAIEKMKLSSEKEEKDDDSNVEENAKSKNISINNIQSVYSVQSNSDLDKFYNIYLHTNDIYTCSCLSYKYGQGKPCKHINGFLNNYYQKYDKFTLVNYLNKNDNIPIVIKNHIHLYTKYFTQKMFNNEYDTEYFTHETKYYGLYVWTFNDSLTDNKLEKESVQKENSNEDTFDNDDESVGPDGTYDGLTDDD